MFIPQISKTNKMKKKMKRNQKTKIRKIENALIGIGILVERSSVKNEKRVPHHIYLIIRCRKMCFWVFLKLRQK